MSQEFKDKVVIVTGASSGIGATTAVMFAQRGAKVTLCGRNPDGLNQTLEQCLKVAEGQRERFLVVRGDLTNADTRKDIVENTVAQFGQLDVLVANAAVIEPRSILDETEDNFDLVINTNVKATFFLIKNALPHLVKSQGNIVIVSSIDSTIFCPTEIVYSMSKAAVDHMTRNLALEFAPKGVRVNAINPTLVWTNVYKEAGKDPELDAFLNACATAHPLHGRASTTEEQAEAMIFLASNAARFITGQCLKVDGGFTLLGCPVIEPKKDKPHQA